VEENDGGKNDFALCMMAMAAWKVTVPPRHHNSFHEGRLLLARLEEHDAETVSACNSLILNHPFLVLDGCSFLSFVIFIGHHSSIQQGGKGGSCRSEP
jgi:hypothetical protein